MKITAALATAAADRTADMRQQCINLVGEDYAENASTPATILIWTAQNAVNAANSAARAALALAPEGTLLTRGTPEADAVNEATAAAEEAEKVATHCWEVLERLRQTESRG